MKQLRKFVKSLILIFFTTSLFGNSGIQFQYGDIELAKSIAGTEGKLYIVEFYADWCGPCKWMDQTTFTNPEVINLVNENFVAVKIDVDDLDGFAWKQQYDVGVLPTILVFNSKGKLLDRAEETMAPSKFVEFLSRHNVEKNKKVISRAVNTSPKDATLYEKPVKKNRYSQRYATPVVTQSVYRLQMGIFSDYEKVVEFYNELRSEFIEPIIVINDIENEKTIYRVLMGEFMTEDEAIDYQHILRQDFSYESVVH